MLGHSQLELEVGYTPSTLIPGYIFSCTSFSLEECPPPPRPPPPSVEVVVPPRPPPPAEAPMDAQVVEMLQRPPEDNRIAVSIVIDNNI